MNRITCALVLAIASFAPGGTAEAADFVVVGYLPGYRVESVTAAGIGPVTDLVFFGLEPPADGRLPDSPVPPAVLRKLHEIKRQAKCRLLFCIGGWNRSKGFPPLAGNAAARQRFIQALLEYCQDNDLDGIDYDWEHPKGEDQIRDYGRLLADTRDAFRDRQLLVTVAQAGWQDLGEVAYKAVDRVHLMSYDHDFPQATISKSRVDVNRLIDWRCPPAKIALGLPFYGRNKRNEARTYDQLVGQKTPDPKLDLIDGFAFNGRATIHSKVRFARTHQLAGVMVWELGQDASRKEASLMNAIRQGLRSPESKSVNESKAGKD